MYPVMMSSNACWVKTNKINSEWNNEFNSTIYQLTMPLYLFCYLFKTKQHNECCSYMNELFSNGCFTVYFLELINNLKQLILAFRALNISA